MKLISNHDEVSRIWATPKHHLTPEILDGNTRLFERGIDYKESPRRLINCLYVYAHSNGLGGRVRTTDDGIYFKAVKRDVEKNK